MDDNDEQTKEFFNCFNSKKNIFLSKQNIVEKIRYLLIANKILTKYKNVDEFLKFKPSGILIGEAVYDHFIRNDNNPSTNRLCYKFLFFLAEALYVNDFCRIFFGIDDLPVKFRPSYFPFTEPSAEVDILSEEGKWLEILGCGIVNPVVLENCNIDSTKFSGLAFGLGIERIAMLKHGVFDIREFYKSNLDFLTQFK